MVFGDSLSAGLGLQSGEEWVSLLQTKLTKNHLAYQVINASISGDTTGNGLARLPLALKSHKPNIVILELGGNDGLRGLSLKTMKQNLAQMIDLCQQQHIKILLVGMQLPPNYGRFYIEQFAQIYTDLAREKQVKLLPFLMKGFGTNLSYFQQDKIHPNAKAQPIIVNNVWQQLQSML